MTQPPKLPQCPVAEMAHLGLRKISEEKTKHQIRRQDAIDSGLPPPPFSELLENRQPRIAMAGGCVSLLLS